MRIRIQEIYEQNEKKFAIEKKIPIAHVSLNLHKGHPSYSRSLQPLNVNIFAPQNLKFFHLLLYLWPTKIKINANPCGFGSTTPANPLCHGHIVKKVTHLFVQQECRIGYLAEERSWRRHVTGGAGRG